MYLFIVTLWLCSLLKIATYLTTSQHTGENMVTLVMGYSTKVNFIMENIMGEWFAAEIM